MSKSHLMLVPAGCYPVLWTTPSPERRLFKNIWELASSSSNLALGLLGFVLRKASSPLLGFLPRYTSNRFEWRLARFVFPIYTRQHSSFPLAAYQEAVFANKFPFRVRYHWLCNLSGDLQQIQTRYLSAIQASITMPVLMLPTIHRLLKSRPGLRAPVGGRQAGPIADLKFYRGSLLFQCFKPSCSGSSQYTYTTRSSYIRFQRKPNYFSPSFPCPSVPPAIPPSTFFAVSLYPAGTHPRPSIKFKLTSSLLLSISIALILFELGTGVRATLESYLSSTIRLDQIAPLYFLYGISDTVGTLIVSPVVVVVTFDYGLWLGGDGFWLGLLYMESILVLFVATGLEMWLGRRTDAEVGTNSE